VGVRLAALDKLISPAALSVHASMRRGALPSPPPITMIPRTYRLGSLARRTRPVDGRWSDHETTAEDMA